MVLSARRCRGWGPALALAVAALAGARDAAADLRLDHFTHTSWSSIGRATSAFAILPDRDGHLWVGTEQHLVRFDGQQMTAFDRQRVPNMVEGRIIALFEDAEGALWVGFRDSGLARLRDGRVLRLDRKSGLLSNFVRGFAQTRDGSVWVATDEGPMRFPPGSEKPEPSGAGLAHRCTHGFVVDRNGVLWAGTHRGLARWSDGRWHPEGGPPQALRADVVYVDRDDTLYVGTRGAGLWERRPDGWRSYTVQHGLGSDDVVSVLRDGRGYLWVATAGGGVARQEGERFVALSLPEGSCRTRVQSLAQDAEGGIWIGSEVCGLRRIAYRLFERLVTANGLPSDDVLGVSTASDGRLWIGTNGAGLATIAPGAMAPDPLPCAPGLPCRAVWAFSPGPAGSMLMVAHLDAALEWDGRAVIRPSLPDGWKAVEFAVFDRAGARWFAVENKVVRVDGTGVTSITEQERLRGKRIVFPGKDGRAWIAADDGVALWRDGKVELMRVGPNDRAAGASNPFEDAGGTLWVGTLGAGIRRVRDGKIVTVTSAHGLPTGWIPQLLGDDHGRLWASNVRGIFWVEIEQMNQLIDGRRKRVDVRFYDAADGVRLNAGGDFGHPAGLRDARGRLWFVTPGEGIAIVDPAHLQTRAPRVVIDELRLGGLALDPNAVHERGPAPLDVEVAFRALSFAPAETIAFRHRLEGKDTDWIEGEPRARYPQLAPGRYTLVVQARSRDGDWGGQESRTAFVLRPPFHRTPWFFALGAVAAGSVLMLAHRLRLARARASMEVLMAERSRIARDIHDTLAQAFVATSVQLECLDKSLEGKDPSVVRRHLDTARKVVNESLEEARRAVWVLRPQALEGGLARALDSLVRGVSGETVVSLEVTGAPRPLAAACETNLLRIAQEAVSNAYRHARPRSIRVRLAYGAGTVTLSATDDGTGLDGMPSEQRGMLGMRERAEELRGTLVVESAPGQGTTIRAEVPA